MKDLMIITSYYPPEIGAASNRIFHLTNGLKEDPGWRRDCVARFN